MYICIYICTHMEFGDDDTSPFPLEQPCYAAGSFARTPLQLLCCLAITQWVWYCAYVIPALFC